jgi:Ca2+-binding EF-hand superfamily protein
MNKTIRSIAAISIMSLATSLAFAEGEKCDTHKGRHAQGMHHDGKGCDHGDMLKEMDADKDGTVTKSEFDSFHALRQAEHFAKMDANKDGKLTGDELTCKHDRSARLDRAEHLAKVFDKADANKDNSLDAKEVKDMPMLSKNFKAVDANKDGKVTREEFFDAMPILHRGKGMDGSGKGMDGSGKGMDGSGKQKPM